MISRRGEKAFFVLMGHRAIKFVHHGHGFAFLSPKGEASPHSFWVSRIRFLSKFTAKVVIMPEGPLEQIM